MKKTLGYIGLLVLAVLWLMPLGTWLSADFPQHMLRHMGLVAIVTPLLVLGFPKVTGVFALSPLAGAAIEFVVVWGWHLPGLHGWADRGGSGLLLEQGSFVIAGLLVWAGALRSGQSLAGAGGLLLTSMHMTLLGALIILAPRDLYAAICGRAPDLDAQQLGGLLMLGIGTPVYLLAGLALVARALDDKREPA
ncbi:MULTISPECIES: cytochrome c oxidase assembly protein [Roseobacteraceae]|uniref:Cytochrome c oxidase caa3 assembly factor (Caa3_CtaG) n=1 Tax=Pseudosulfitobacter pseudonitzschiae TaxID=1402135 RepID=A0A221JVT0_9RHOB|nr:MULTISPECIES: cytochrome c oxidase assembly protein [Roseobacteraceae]ASM70844.1 cytochrome c oxidase caa3 assembly factor (Caa3_CtaG) [Pseudosulfitobacter pseudonitzschiae]